MGHAYFLFGFKILCNVKDFFDSRAENTHLVESNIDEMFYLNVIPEFSE